MQNLALGQRGASSSFGLTIAAGDDGSVIGHTATMGTDGFLGKVICGETEAVVAALAGDPALATARSDGIGSTPLHFSAHRGHAAIVRALLDAGAELEARETASNSTPLHWAAEGGHAEVAEMLLDAGAVIDPVDAWFGLTPLGWATVVVWAPPFHDDRPAVARLLLARGASHDIFSAVATGDEDSVRVLAGDAALLHARLGYVMSSLAPLHLAVARGLPDVVRLLLALGADLETRTLWGLTPLAVALGGKSREHAAIAAILRAAGARSGDASVALLEADEHALRAALVATETPPRQVLDALLFVAAERGLANGASLLLAQGADADARIRHVLGELPADVSPLHRAAEAGHEDIVELLLSAGADTDPGKADGMPTPLHFAAGSGHAGIVRRLLASGADAGAVELGYGATARDWAEHGEHDEIVALLDACRDG